MSFDINNFFISKKAKLSLVFFTAGIFFLFLLYFTVPCKIDLNLNFSNIFSLNYIGTAIFYLYGVAAWTLPIMFFMSAIIIYFFENFNFISFFSNLLIPYFASFFCAIYSYNGSLIYPSGGSLGQIFLKLGKHLFKDNYIFYSKIFFAITCICILQIKGIIFLSKMFNLILEKLKIYDFCKFIYFATISWIIYFIPRAKKILPKTPYCIQLALDESLNSDFEEIRLIYDLEATENYKAPFKIYPAVNFKNEVKKINELEEIQINAALKKGKIDAEIISSFVGPIITTVVIKLSENEKIAFVRNSEEEIARLCGKPELRIVYPLKEFPFCIGLEYKSEKREIVEFIKNINALNVFENNELNLLLGIDVRGNPFTINLCKMPHVLISGTTGSGKSSLMHSLIMSILWKYSPEEVLLVLIDPKSVEFTSYENIPHLKMKIARDIKKIEECLQEILLEMTTRYDLLQNIKVKNIQEFYLKLPEKRQNYPYIVIFIDEYADLIMQNKEIENIIIRLAQMARAAGIHLVLSTQRPSADVINSTLKANIPARIACKVSSAVDSRIIIGANGAEKLLGNGDMLFLNENSEIIRLHGVYPDIVNIEKIITFIKSQKNNTEKSI